MTYDVKVHKKLKIGIGEVRIDSLNKRRDFFQVEMDSVLSNKRETHNSSMPVSKITSIIKSKIQLL